MKKLCLLFIGLFCMISICSVYADDDELIDDEEYIEERIVSARMSCDEIQNEIKNIKVSAQSDEELSIRLEELTAQYRSKCSKKTVGAKRSKKVATAILKQKNISQELCENGGAPDVNGCCDGEEYQVLDGEGYCCIGDTCYTPLKVIKTSKLCQNGGQPDDNGCCDGETYTNMGNDKFYCCPENSDECFEPIK